MFRRFFAAVAAAGAVALVPAVAMAADNQKVSVLGPGAAPDAFAQVKRTHGEVTFKVHDANLNAGTYRYQVAVFNHPENCVAHTPFSQCTPGPDSNAATGFAFTRGTFTVDKDHFEFTVPASLVTDVDGAEVGFGYATSAADARMIFTDPR